MWRDFQSHYSKEQREYIKKIMRMMRFTNSLGNTLSRKSSNSETEASSAACIIQNREYAPKTEAGKDGKDHANIVAHPPVIFGIVLAVGFLIHKCFPLAIMSHAGSLSKVLAGILFVIAGIIMVSTTRLMLRKKTDPRPDRPTTTNRHRGFLQILEKSLVPFAHADLQWNCNLCKFIVVGLPAPSAFSWS